MKLFITAALACAVSVSFAADRHEKKQATTQTQAKEETTPQKDPVCGMTIEPSQAEAKAVYKGKTYYFCSREDKDEFEKAPAKYAKK